MEQAIHSADAANDELACPICSYSLRGLAEPRCPECGYQFDWDALRAAIKAKHAYLYEHGRGLAIMRMIRTFAHGLRPGKFWATLNAAMEIRLRRLAIYWIVTAMFVVAGILVLPYGNFLVTRTRLAMQTRKQISAMLANPAAAAQTKPILKQFGSASAVLDAYAPLPWSWRFWQTVPGMVTWPGSSRGYSQSLVYMIYAAVLAVLWPWITLGLLAIFVQLRGRAKIRWAQLVRCVVYSGDIAVFCGVAAFALNAFQASFDYRFQGPIPAAIILMLLMMTSAGWKMSLALKKYLRMPHATAVVASTQMIALLAVLIVIPYEATMWLIRVVTLR